MYSRFLQTKWPDLEKSRSCWDCPCFHMYQDSLNPFRSSRQNTKGSPPCQPLSSIQIQKYCKPWWQHTAEDGLETFWCARYLWLKDHVAAVLWAAQRFTEGWVLECGFVPTGCTYRKQRVQTALLFCKHWKLAAKRETTWVWIATWC